jgi:hypothetical protein
MDAEHEQEPLSLIVFEFNQDGRLRTESLGPALGRQLIDQTMWLKTLGAPCRPPSRVALRRKDSTTLAPSRRRGAA